MYLPTTTDPSVCHSLSPNKRKLFCLFVCRDTLSCYGVGAFSLSIPYGMHLVVPTQFWLFWVICHPNRTLLLKEPKQEPQNRSFPSPHHQTKSFYLWPMTSLCPILAGYRLVRFGPCTCLSSMYVQNLSTAYAFAVVDLHNLLSIFTIFWFPFPFWLALLRDWALLNSGLYFSSAHLMQTPIDTLWDRTKILKYLPKKAKIQILIENPDPTFTSETRTKGISNRPWPNDYNGIMNQRYNVWTPQERVHDKFTVLEEPKEEQSLTFSDFLFNSPLYYNECMLLIRHD